MTAEKIQGFIRHVLTFGGGFVVAKGWTDEATMTQIVGALSTVIGALWSWFSPEKARG